MNKKLLFFLSLFIFQFFLADCCLAQTSEQSDFSNQIQFAVNDIAQPSPHYSSPYLFDVSWGYDQQDRLYLKAKAEYATGDMVYKLLYATIKKFKK